MENDLELLQGQSLQASQESFHVIPAQVYEGRLSSVTRQALYQDPQKGISIFPGSLWSNLFSIHFNEGCMLVLRHMCVQTYVRVCGQVCL